MSQILRPKFTVIIYTIVTMKNRLALAIAIALTVAIFLLLSLSSGGVAYYYNRLTDEFNKVILATRMVTLATK